MFTILHCVFFRLWAFVLDYNILEKEVAEPLMDLKQAIAEIESNKTFRIILSTVLAIGNFLNGSPVKGFQLDYLAKVCVPTGISYYDYTDRCRNKYGEEL